MDVSSWLQIDEEEPLEFRLWDSDEYRYKQSRFNVSVVVQR